MSDIGLDWGPLDIALMALIIGAPGLVLGSTCGPWRGDAIGCLARSLARWPGCCCGLLGLLFGK